MQGHIGIRKLQIARHGHLACNIHLAIRDGIEHAFTLNADALSLGLYLRRHVSCIHSQREVGIGQRQLISRQPTIKVNISILRCGECPLEADSHRLGVGHIQLTALHAQDVGGNLTRRAQCTAVNLDSGHLAVHAQPLGGDIQLAGNIQHTRCNLAF